jgi:hypothetical protein
VTAAQSFPGSFPGPFRRILVGTGGVPHPRLGHVAATAARSSSLPVLLAP